MSQAEIKFIQGPDNRWIWKKIAPDGGTVFRSNSFATREDAEKDAAGVDDGQGVAEVPHSGTGAHEPFHSVEGPVPGGPMVD